MKFLSIAAQGFRGFGRRTIFPLGDVNILGGPNGFGKTSFFDSVLWCIFGSIPRLSGTRDFVHAGNVHQNKFSSSPCSVELTIETADGLLVIKRTSTTIEARIGEAQIGAEGYLKLLKLADDDGMSRFLRNFQLQQETINEFVRELNPRGRYDSLISFLEFQVANTLTTRLDELTVLVNVPRARAQQDFAVAEQRVSNLNLDLERLRGLVLPQLELEQAFFR
jgi:DNA repair protein SbcC/Rad50